VGLMGAVELVRDKESREPFPVEAKVAARVRDAGWLSARVPIWSVCAVRSSWPGSRSTPSRRSSARRSPTLPARWRRQPRRRA